MNIRRLYNLFCWFLYGVILSFPQPIRAQIYLTKQWQGEFFAKKQGGFYIKANPSDLLSNAYDFRFKIKNLLSKKNYVITQAVDEISGPPQEVWKVPSGKYQILFVSIVDNKGVVRKGRPARKWQQFAVKRHSISNLGLWTIKPKGSTFLTINTKQLKNSFASKKDDPTPSVAAVFDGYKGLIQQIIGGKNTLEHSKSNFSTTQEGRMILNYKINISMTYSLNLFRHNRRAQPIMDVVKAADPNIRQCYLEVLQSHPHLQGKLKFRFILSKNTQAIKSLKHSGGSLQHPPMTNCVYHKLGALTFPVKVNMIGELIFNFHSTN